MRVGKRHSQDKKQVRLLPVFLPIFWRVAGGKRHLYQSTTFWAIGGVCRWRLAIGAGRSQKNESSVHQRCPVSVIQGPLDRRSFFRDLCNLVRQTSSLHQQCWLPIQSKYPRELTQKSPVFKKMEIWSILSL